MGEPRGGGPGGGCHALAGPGRGRGEDGGGGARAGADAHGAAAAVRLRAHRAVGASSGGAALGSRGPGRGVAGHARGPARGAPLHGGRVRGRRRGPGPVRVDLSPLAPAPAGRPDAGREIEATERFWTDWVGQGDYDGAVGGGGHAVAGVAQGADLCPDRRDRGGGHDVAARAARRDAELGLPVLLAAGRDLHPAGAARHRVRAGGRGLAGLAAAGGGRGPGRPADHVRHRRHPAADRAGAGLAGRLRGIASGADRQCRGRTSSSSTCGARSWTGCTWPVRRACPASPPPGTCSGRCWTTSRGTGRTRTTACGRCAGTAGTSCIPR